jgi:hypothetical protein
MEGSNQSIQIRHTVKIKTPVAHEIHNARQKQIEVVKKNREIHAMVQLGAYSHICRFQG